MKKFMSKLESKMDGSSGSSNKTSASNAGYYGSPASQARPVGQGPQSQSSYGPPPGAPPPQQYQQQQQGAGYMQQQCQPGTAMYSQPPGPPPPAASYQQPAQAPMAQRPAGGVEDPFAALRRYDTVLIVDDSESMEMFWDETREALVGVVEKAVQYDEDGIDIHFYNSTVVVNNLRTAQDVRSIFRRVDPRRSTPTATAIRRVLQPYLLSLEEANRAKQTGRPVAAVKPLNVVILTDGAPDRGEEPEGILVDAGKRLDAIRAPPYQLGFSFVQIGADEEAQEALTFLDDHLKTEYGIRDFVDTTVSPPNGQVSADYLLKALLGGINRKLDRQN